MPHYGEFQTVKPVPELIAPTLLNSWVNYGAPYQSAGYFKDAAGVVHLCGLVKDGTVDPTTGVIFTLPAGYRPAAEEVFAVVSNAALGRADVFANGNVIATLGTNTYFALSGISFRAAT